jgi:uncharacterized protein
MKQSYRFVDSDMHIVEAPEIWEKYLDPAYRPRVTTGVRKDRRGRSRVLIDGKPQGEAISDVQQMEQYNWVRAPIMTARSNSNVDFAIKRNFDPESQLMAMEMEGIDIAVLFPTAGYLAASHSGLDPQFVNALRRAYNDWLHDFCQYSPDQLKMAAVLPMQDVNLACRELERCVRDFGAVGAVIRPHYFDGRYWHSQYWEPLYGLAEEMGVALCFHGSSTSPAGIMARFGENRFMRQVASHPTEMQLAVIALLLGGIFEAHPKLRVGFLEAQGWWLPGILERAEGLLTDYKNADAAFMKLNPLEYFQRNCFCAVEGEEASLGLLVDVVGAENLCMSTDFPHHDSGFPNVSTKLLGNATISRHAAAKILSGGARLYGFTDEDFAKADAAAAAHKGRAAVVLQRG